MSKRDLQRLSRRVTTTGPELGPVGMLLAVLLALAALPALALAQAGSGVWESLRLEFLLHPMASFWPARGCLRTSW